MVKTPELLRINFLDRVRVSSEFATPEPPRNVGEFDYQKWCSIHHINAVSSANSSVEIVNNHGNVLGLMITSLRNHIESSCVSNLPASTAAVASGILLSITDDLPYELQEAFGRTGTIHVLSTSGMHISVLVSTIGTIMIWSGRSLSAITGIGASAIIGYASGGGPAPIRAVTSLMTRIVSRLLVRAPEPWHLVSICAIVAILRDPYVVLDSGAQLSFLAVIGLIVSAPFASIISHKIRQTTNMLVKCWLTLVQSLVVSFVVTLITSPTVAFHMLHVSVVSPIANVPVGFLSEWALIVGALSVTLEGLPIIGTVLWTLLHGILLVLTKVSFMLSSAPYSDFATGSPSPTFVICLTALLTILLFKIGRSLTRHQSVTEPQYYIPWSTTKPIV